ncbi:hypothetical protein GPECTOR_99g816 [Gonium pectorale]|uniref:Peptidase M43 pregnancy-associated plasma-A domain-containing protein n=1 Tax=Gonium pectorale TaxID=33097 RepID=A0A150G033_GONPE|nr:hypothetical protein GPECTOR_99g816 [Gonium pectorale]|eukprot:KXZ43181.1 hypothetical protein GPECTOR_99g816 [Gonium pectorale]
MPRLLIPLVFHILLYNNTDGSFGPTVYGAAAENVAKLVQLANMMSARTNIQFSVKEVRNDPARYPYLLRGNRSAWLHCFSSRSCLAGFDLYFQCVRGAAADFPRSINVYVASDSTATSKIVGSATLPGSDVSPPAGYALLTWDSLTTGTQPETYYDGGVTLVHEPFHFLGLAHTFGPDNDGGGCEAGGDDYVNDTPSTAGARVMSGRTAANVSHIIRRYMPCSPSS